MKTLQRILIILGLAALVSLVTWAAVTVITVASLPTDTMTYSPQTTEAFSIADPGFVGYIKPLILISLIVIIEQFIEKLFSKKQKRTQITNP